MSNNMDQPYTKDITAITINTGGLPYCSICNIALHDWFNIHTQLATKNVNLMFLFHTHPPTHPRNVNPWQQQKTR